MFPVPSPGRPKKARNGSSWISANRNVYNSSQIGAERTPPLRRVRSAECASACGLRPVLPPCRRAACGVGMRVGVRHRGSTVGSSLDSRDADTRQTILLITLERRATLPGDLTCSRCPLWVLCRCSLARARGQTPSLAGGGCAGASIHRTRRTSPACRRTRTARAHSGTLRHGHPARRIRGGGAAVAMQQPRARSEPSRIGAGRSGAGPGRLVAAPDCLAAPRRSQALCLRARARAEWFAPGCCRVAG